MAPVLQTADLDNQDGGRIDLLLCVNFTAPSGGLKGHRIALELGATIYQLLNSPQLVTDWVFTAGYQIGF